MTLWTAEQRDRLFDTFERDAFHLELRDAYHVDSEDDSYNRWKHGESPDPSDYDRPWLRCIRSTVSSGRTVRRVRIVSEPASEYIRYEYDSTPQNLAAGEDIRWLPRRLLPADLVFPVQGKDWWLFDDTCVAIGHIDDRGVPQGSEITSDPVLARHCAAVRDRLWAIAIPHDSYKLA
jgi:hypothetical protein